MILMCFESLASALLLFSKNLPAVVAAAVEVAMSPQQSDEDDDEGEKWQWMDSCVCLRLLFSRQSGDQTSDLIVRSGSSLPPPLCSSPRSCSSLFDRRPSDCCRDDDERDDRSGEKGFQAQVSDV